MIAVSDGGTITRLDGWKEPRKPFRVFVTKADLVPDKIVQELERHRAGSRLLHVKPTGEYGLWSMEESEATQVAEFLAEQHVDRSLAAPADSARPRRPLRPSRDIAPGGMDSIEPWKLGSASARIAAYPVPKGAQPFCMSWRER